MPSKANIGGVRGRGTSMPSAWDERLTGERIDRVLAECKSKREIPLLRAFADGSACFHALKEIQRVLKSK